MEKGLPPTAKLHGYLASHSAQEVTFLYCDLQLFKWGGLITAMPRALHAKDIHEGAKQE